MKDTFWAGANRVQSTDNYGGKTMTNREKKQEKNLTESNYRDKANKPGPKLNKIELAARNAAIIQDYITGMNYRQIAKKYGLSKAALVPILNNKEALQIREQAFKERVALIPKAVDEETALLESKDDRIRLRVIHKLYDDVGIGTAHTPYNVALNFFNQQNVVFSQFAKEIVDDLTGKAVNKVAPELLEELQKAQYTEETTNDKNEK